MSTLTVDRPTVTPVTHETATGGPGESAHIVYAPDHLGVTPQALVLAARIEGFEVEALCGYTWVPVRDPAPLPVCEACLSAYQQDGANRDDRNELPDA